MRKWLRSSIVLALLAPVAAAGQVPVVAPPTQINPFNGAQVNTPALFQWTALPRVRPSTSA